MALFGTIATPLCLNQGILECVTTVLTEELVQPLCRCWLSPCPWAADQSWKQNSSSPALCRFIFCPWGQTFPFCQSLNCARGASCFIFSKRLVGVTVSKKKNWLKGLEPETRSALRPACLLAFSGFLALGLLDLDRPVVVVACLVGLKKKNRDSW